MEIKFRLRKNIASTFFNVLYMKFSTFWFDMKVTVALRMSHDKLISYINSLNI